jgi:YHS domain-containing protein
MKSRAKVILLLFVVFTFVAANLTVCFAKEGTQVTCPVMGGKINKDLYVDYKGMRVYFCCAACPKEFNKDPEKYIKKLQDEGVILEKAPKSG